MTMSKFKLIAIALAFAGSLISGALVFTAPTGARVLAQGALLECGVTNPQNPSDTQGAARPCELCDLFALISNVIKYLTGIVGSIALLALIVGGIMYIIGPSLGGGEHFGPEQAKKIILTSLIGIILIGSSWLILLTAARFAGYTTTESIKGLTTIQCGTIIIDGKAVPSPVKQLQDEVSPIQ